MHNNGRDDDELPPPQRPPSPPPHTTFAARGIHAPTFSAFKPRDMRIPSQQTMNHVAWNCDGKRLAAVGIDKVVRVWQPEKSVEIRSATIFSGGHTDDVDYVSWHPAHPDLFCTSSQKDRRIVFWDARQSRCLQQFNLKVAPLQTTYSPDGKTLVYTTTGRQFFALKYSKEPEEAKEMWRMDTVARDIDVTRVLFSPTGKCIAATMYQGALLRILSWPGLESLHHSNTHVGGCTATVLDPRGRYVATGGMDTIVNLFDTEEWISARTITCSEYPTNALSFSYDGEYLAIASQGPYIDICATETGVPLHRIPALGPAQTVAWHPSKYVIAYCGQTEKRDVGPPPAAWISLFGSL